MLLMPNRNLWFRARLLGGSRSFPTKTRNTDDKPLSAGLDATCDFSARREIQMINHFRPASTQLATFPTKTRNTDDKPLSAGLDATCDFSDQDENTDDKPLSAGLDATCDLLSRAILIIKKHGPV
jgi:hypothetical protein